MRLKIALIALMSAQVALAETIDETRLGIAGSLGFIGGFGVSYFDKNYHGELAFTTTSFSDDYVDGNGKTFDQHENLHTLHLRKFFKDQTGGYYYGGFVQFASLEGKSKLSHRLISQNKIALGAEVGYTSFNLFGNRALYWGAGIGLGGYFGDNDEEIDSEWLTSNSNATIHLDLLRIGMVF